MIPQEYYSASGGRVDACLGLLIKSEESKIYIMSIFSTSSELRLLS
jgi:hypothetical protein